MKILLNEKSIDVNEDCSLSDLLEQHLDDQTAGNAAFAIAINMQFIPRTNYAQTQLNEGDNIELLAPMQGG